MQPNQESDELHELLEVGYAAPPLDDAFSSNLVRQLQAEVAQHTLQPRSRHARWAVALSAMAVAASIWAVIYVLNPLGTYSGEEVAMQSVPNATDDMITSLESKSTRSLQTESRQTNAVESNNIPSGLVEQKSKSELTTKVPREIVQSDSKTNENLRSLSKFERSSEAMMELSRTNGVAVSEGERQGGTWPKDWPQGLEHLRALSSSEFHNAKHATVEHRIPFAERASFEASWPHFLDLMKRKHFKFVLTSSRPAKSERFIGVAVLCPDSEEDLSQETEVPEFKKMVMYLFVDGEIIDLNRIQLPTDKPIIDERFKTPKSE